MWNLTGLLEYFGKPVNKIQLLHIAMQNKAPWKVQAKHISGFAFISC